ncbi:ATP-binding cassette sub-family C member 4-like [Schistocerca gregaria]|uniref:ATP-binding cassette sub-family C member 4-like n=1 Tax=Schistocerca gregaria TaxID=7010 RepID=UPI00211E4003|nr:ATP-binding cassette sub-family C member 4-like [Schistocerca gregaria]
MDTTRRKCNPNPRATANPVSVLFFWWLKDLFKKGTEKDLEIDDLYDALKRDNSQDLGNRLEANWKYELKRVQGKHGTKPSLTRAIFKTFIGQYVIHGLMLGFYHLILRIAQPIFLAAVIRHFTNNEVVSRQEMYWYSGALILSCVISLFIMHHSTLIAQCVGMRVRVACCSLVYRKIMRLSKISLGQTAAGQMVNLLSNDVNRFDLVPLFLQFIWITPIQAVIATYFIWQFVGWASIIGVTGLFLQTVPVQSYMSTLTTKFRMQTAIRSDDRIRLMNEIISGIQVIKMYAWEKPFEKMVHFARSREIRVLRGASYLRGIHCAFMVFTERTSLYITLVAYTLLGHSVTAEKVFSLAQFFNALQLCMAICYPSAVQFSAEAKVSIRRLEAFLMQEEHVPRVINGPAEEKGTHENGLVMKGVCAKWAPGSISETLSSINLHVKPGKLCAVIGPVGAGKSSLLHAVLGELPITGGSISADEKISYASQDPWLFVGSVRQNILFGQPYDSKKYREVIRACALTRDFELFPYGDKTVVGERGVALSGGQRARINLARAVYRNADLYLLDDPLSAVDTHVGKQLYEDCINGYLCTKTRILVTHQLQYLKDADHIIILNNGKIEDQGTFSELTLSKKNFANMLANNQEETKEAIKSSREELRQQLSITSTFSKGDEDDEVEEPTETAEMLEKGKLSNTLYKDYFTAGSSWLLLCWLVVVLLLGQIASSGADYWVTYWTNQEQLRKELIAKQDAYNMPNSSFVPSFEAEFPLDESNSFSNTTLLDILNTTEAILGLDVSTEWNDSEFSEKNNPSLTLKDYDNQPIYHRSMFFTRDQYIYIYTICIIGSITITILRSLVFFKITMNSSQGLHDRMFNTILKGTMRFFDTNPSGRVLNRFSKDMGAVDEMLPRAMLDAIQIFLVMTGILIMVVIVNYYFVIVIIVLGPLFYKIRCVYLETAQDIKRLEGVTRSPVFSYVSASLNGLTTIRSSTAQEMVMKEFDSLQDLHTSAWYISIASNAAFGFVLDAISTSFVSAVILSFLLMDTSTLGGYVGLAISQSLILTGMLQYGIRQTTEVVNQMTSVERVLQYNNIDKEPSFESEPGRKPPPTWPQHGAVRFEGVSLRYAVAEPPVLKNLKFEIEAGQKVGIVGRTGAGKSSLISALFRLANLEGAIYIDNIHTQDIGLHDLRKRISIIPQEPVLFSASIRYNLDPFQEFPDHQIWNALEEVELKPVVDGLDMKINEGGSNFSVGQRQLICLARAILRNNKILVLDEATANVDPQTDALIQIKIREKFSNCTVLTIAHRLHTIMDSDKVLVMDSGTMVEFAHPHELLQDSEGYFTKMVQKTGAAMAAQLTEVAESSYRRRNLKTTSAGDISESPD